MGSITLTKLDTNANVAASCVTLTKASSLMQPSTNSFSVKVPSPKKISEPKENLIIHFINHHISFLMIYCHSVQITLQQIIRNLTSNKKYSSSPSTSKALKSSRARLPGSNFLKKKTCQKCQKVGKLRILELRLKELSCCCIWSDGYPSSGDLCICNL